MQEWVVQGALKNIVVFWFLGQWNWRSGWNVCSLTTNVSSFISGELRLDQGTLLHIRVPKCIHVPWAKYNLRAWFPKKENQGRSWSLGSGVKGRSLQIKAFWLSCMRMQCNCDALAIVMSSWQCCRLRRAKQMPLAALTWVWSKFSEDILPTTQIT